MPTKPVLDEKVDSLNKLINRSWTEEELQTKLRRSGVLAAKNANLERVAIMKRRNIAIEMGNEADIFKCDNELKALEGPKLAFGTSLAPPAAKSTRTGPTQQERLAEINRANRRANQEDIRNAQLAEREAEYKNQAAIARGEAVANPFARVKTRAKVMHDVHASDALTPKSASQTAGGDVSRGTTPVSGMNTPNSSALKPRQGTPTVKLVADQPKGIPTIRKRLMDDEIIAQMDLGIDLDIVDI